MRKAKSEFLLIVCIAALFGSCSNKSSIVGRWRQAGSPYVIEFSKDGTVGLGDEAMSFDGKYSFADDSHIRIEFGSGYHTLGGQVEVHLDTKSVPVLGEGFRSMRPPPTNATVSISGSELRLTDDQGGIFKYKRVN